MTLRVAVSGASGRMGQLVSAALTAGGDAVVTGFDTHHLPSPEGMAGVDVVIDFSTPEALR
nr:4-hydroxy-tetrahydrodipicolinate reductase [Deltaproteobacteria bacterium]